MAIREATDDDVGALASIQEAASRLAYAGIFDAADPPPTLQRIALRWASLMARPRSWIGLLEVEGDPVAAIAVQPSPDADLDGSEVGEVCSFYVLPRYWGERRGRALFEQALAEADALGFTAVRLWVLEANVRARRIYAERHWVADGVSREVAAGVREVRYRAPDPAGEAATSTSSVTSIDLDDLYDAETAARIDAGGPSDPRRPVGRVRRKGVASAMAAAMMMGLREVFDPPRRSEIEQVDPWEGGGTNPWVKVHLDPDPRQTIAEVRDP